MHDICMLSSCYRHTQCVENREDINYMAGRWQYLDSAFDDSHLIGIAYCTSDFLELSVVCYFASEVLCEEVLIIYLILPPFS